jgi:diacylglycerol kinase family enzyme
MSRKIIYLINPISGTRGKRSLREMIQQKTQEQGIDFSILPTNAEGDYSHLPDVIRNQGVTDIVVCGGDGTVNAVAAALYRPGQSADAGSSAYVGPGVDFGPSADAGGASLGEAEVRLGVIPMGSGNGLAFAAGIPKDPAKALELIFAGHAAYIDGVLINDQFSCMLCGIGMDGKVAHEFAGQQRRGLETYIRITMRNFFSARPYPFRLCIPARGTAQNDIPAGDPGRHDPPTGAHGQHNDSERHEPSPAGAHGQRELIVDAFFISIANGNQFGNNFTIAPKASLQDGLLDIVIAKKTSRLLFLWSVIRQVLGGYPVQPAPDGDGPGRIIYFQTPSLVIENPAEAPLHIDGDPKPSARSFRISVVPRAIQLIQP